MKQFTSLDLQQRSGDIQRSALSEPAVITNHGNPRLVVMSTEEYVRLKAKAGEPVPPEARRRAAVQSGLPPDPLGRDTRDITAFVAEVAEHAIAGRDRAVVDSEIAGAERWLGIVNGGSRAQS